MRDMSDDLLSRIMTDPDQCGGRLCIRATPIREQGGLDIRAGAASPEEILEDFTNLKAEGGRASLVYGAARIGDTDVIAA
jgi:uncharacterized protein (DUF433 family)